MPIIRTKKFILRPFKKGDEASLVKNINNKKIAKYTLRIPYPYTLKDATFWILQNRKLWRKKVKSSLNFAIDISGEVVGGIGLNKIEGHEAELGYWLGEKYWGKGVMTAAVKALTEYVFKTLPLRRIYAEVFPFNKASAKVLQKAGYKYEGRLRKHVLKNGKFIDALLFARVR